MPHQDCKNTSRVLPPSPPNIPPAVEPEHLIEPLKRGRQINLITNHFRVSVNVPDAVFFQYNVSIKSGDNYTVEGKGVGRKVMDRLYQIYYSEMEGKQFAYDDEASFLVLMLLFFWGFFINEDDPLLKLFSLPLPLLTCTTTEDDDDLLLILELGFFCEEELEEESEIERENDFEGTGCGDE
ncbi:argonaute [Thalictrum thalictroides]|uniref:Argonaute n=1 Tax=Thalictrum thalictroides TaxID=46969 RepID=A0A7J6XEK5_THATH|nr:argonaute [Thalictrum thalictroides]